MLACIADKKTIILLTLQFAFAAALGQRDTALLSIFFSKNSWVLSANQAMALRTKLSSLKSDCERITVLGFTDKSGSALSNAQLSLRRALSVASFIRRTLVGLPPDSILALGKGISPNAGDDDSGARRCEIRAFLKSGLSSISPEVRKDNRPDTTMVLENLFFIPDKSILTASSRLYIPDLIRKCKVFEKDSIEIIGFCNQPGPQLLPSDPLYQLSIQRAHEIYDYFVAAGFPVDHLSYKGVGNAQAKQSSDTIRKPESNPEGNMRVEIHVFFRNK